MVILVIITIMKAETSVKDLNPRQVVAILRILRDAREPIGSSVISEELKNYGFEHSSRTIRLYLQEMETAGLVTPSRRGRDGGRSITSLGLEEIRDALVKDRVDFMATKVDNLAYKVTFHPEKRKGLIVVNLTIIDQAHLKSAVQEMTPAFRAGMGMGDYVYLAQAGEQFGDYYIPPGKIGLGTVCSVTLNGVLLNSRIPTVSRFGGVLEFHQGQPSRLTDLIYYNGTSLDPLEIFIKGRLTSVREAARTGHGRIGASFREIPSAALSEMSPILRQLKEIGLGGVLLLGKPNQPLLEFPVEEGRTGLIVSGGLNPISAIEEAGIPTVNHALCTLLEFDKMIHYKEVLRMVTRDEFHFRMSDLVL
jgi:repressor of nif and glnA expression